MMNEGGGEISVKNGILRHRPDSLKLIAQLTLLKHVHRIAFDFDDSLGDNSSDKTLFIRGVQGKVSRPVWNRDYFYLNGKMQKVRDHLEELFPSTVSNELFKLALDIFNCADNRRRMGVELLVLLMLTTKRLSSFELPDKYYSHAFVIDMLVSIKHRFQKPVVTFFWSKQSEAILLGFFRQSSANNLTKLSLSLVNDMLLKAISVYVPNLVDFEMQLALDCTEDGLLALSGFSATPTDQGLQRNWEHSLYLHKDMGSPKEWYIKDCLLFTPPPKRNLPPSQWDSYLPPLYSTGFGCKKLVKLSLRGDYIFPPLSNRLMRELLDRGPILEIGFYALLLGLPNLEHFVTNSTALMVARLRNVIPEQNQSNHQLSLKKLNISPDEELTSQDLEAITVFCPKLTDLFIKSSIDHLCPFISKFDTLVRIGLILPLSCLNNYLINSGSNLSSLDITSTISNLGDLLLLRKYAPNLTKLRGKFTYDSRINNNNNGGVTDNYHNHDDKVIIGDSSKRIYQEELLELEPWKHLQILDLSGRLNLIILQILVANSDNLKFLNVTSTPHRDSNNGIALNDEWIDGLIFVNSLKNIQEISLRMDSEHFVEDGSFTKSGLVKFLNYASENCSKLEVLTGEFTKIPDKELKDLEMKLLASRINVEFHIRNAEPYREFQNSEDNDRYYGMNEGYWRYVRDPHPPMPGGGAPNPPVSSSSVHENRLKYQRTFGYVYRPCNIE